jgi:hypothetical protein
MFLGLPFQSLLKIKQVIIERAKKTWQRQQKSILCCLDKVEKHTVKPNPNYWEQRKFFQNKTALKHFMKL